MPKPSPKSLGVSAVPVAPSGAEHFSLDRITYVPKTNPETGKKHSQTVVRRCQGEARADGTIPEVWAASEFSTKHVLDAHGAGRFKVTWYNKAGDKLTHSIFELANPPGRKAHAPRREGRLGELYEPLRPAPRSDEDGGGELEAGMPKSPIGWFMLMQQREEAAAERRRAEAREEDQRRRDEADRQRQQDRDFFQNILGFATKPAATGGGVDMDLLKREMRVGIQEHMIALRADLAQQGGGDDDDDNDRGGDDRKPPRNLEEAGSRVAVAVLEDIEQRAPELLQKVVPELWRWLTEAGYKPSAKVARAIAEATADGQAE